MKWFRWWWLVLLIPIIAGLARLHFDVEVLDLLPGDIPAVQGLKIYQEHFANARELIITVSAPDREAAAAAAETIATQLLGQSNLVATVSHELKTPLTSVRMALYLLHEKNIGSLNDKQADLVETARFLSRDII